MLHERRGRLTRDGSCIYEAGGFAGMAHSSEYP